MKRLRVGFSLSLVAVVAAFAPACSGDGTMSEEDIGELEQFAHKGSPGAANGQADYCWTGATGSNLCGLGEGDCDSSAQCASPYLCIRGKGPQFGFVGDVCAPQHCGNKVKDGDETQTDCGGSCGSICPAACSGVPANGQTGHCTIDCPCPAGQGDCDTNTQCTSGNVCVLDTGALYGFAPGVDMCMASTCSSGTQNGDETGVDCGGSCPPCGGTYKSGTNFGGTSHGEAVAVDTAGNVFMAGRFVGPTNFGCGAMTSADATKSDVFLVKFSSTGSCLWSKRVGSSGGGDGDNGVALHLDSAGNPVLGSNFYLTADFLTAGNKVSAGSADMFVMKLSGSTGALAWLKTFGSTGVDRILGLDVDGSNNVFFTGAFSGTVNFGGGGLVSAGSTDVAVVKLNSSGTHQWSKRFGGTGADIGYGISADTLGNTFVGGQFAGMVDFGTGALTSSGISDGFLIKLNSGATATSYAKQLGGSSDDLVRDVSVDSSGRAVIAGRFKNSVDLGGGVVSLSGTHAFVAGYSNTGVYSFGKTVGGSGVSQAFAVTRDNNGNSAIVGYFQGSVDLGSGTVASAGADDVFILRYTLAGALSWTAHYGSTGGDQALAARYGGKLLYVTGNLNDSASLGGPVLNGGADAFLASYVF